MKTIVEQLNNGMTVVMQPSDKAPVIAFQVWVGVGSANEQKGEEGLAHVLEHMLFKGTDKRAVGEITRDVEKAGGQINAWTSYEETVYYITIADRFWEQGLEILSDAVFNSSLDPDELSKELKVILEEIRMGEDSPDHVLVKDLFSSLFQQHPYGRPIIGSVSSVSSFTRKKINSFYKRWYVPSNMVLSIAGNFSVEKMTNKVGELFGQYKGASSCPRKKEYEKPNQKAVQFSCSVKPVSEARFALAFPIPGLEHEDTPALDLSATVLGQGMSARLENKIRRELSLVTDIRSMAYTLRDMGVFAVFATCPHHLLDKAVSATLKELDIALAPELSLSEIKKAKTMIEADSIYSEETVDGLARKAGFYRLHTGDCYFEEKYLERVALVNASKIRAVMSEYLVGKRATLSVIIPDPSRRAPAHKLLWIEGKGKERKLNINALKRQMVSHFIDFRKTQKSIGSNAKKTKTIIHGKTQLFKLGGGDLLLVRPDASSKTVAVRAACLGGLRLEPEKHAGLYALMSNTLIRGTQNHSAEEIAQKMDSLACSISGFTGRNTFGIQGEFLSSNFYDGFSLLADCFRRPVFEEQEVELERQLLLEDIRQTEDNPSKQAFLHCFKNLFGKHPYSRMSQGTLETVEKITCESMKKVLRSVTAVGRTVISVVGGVDVNDIRSAADELLSSQYKDSKKLLFPSQAQLIKKPKCICVNLPKEQSHIAIGFLGTTLTSNDRFAVDVMTEILGGHGGRLFQHVREEAGLAYSVTAVSMEGVDPGYLALYAATTPGGEQRVYDALRKEVEKICSKRVAKEELSRVKRHLVGTHAISLQRNSGRAASIALDYLYGNGHDASERYAKQIDAVSSEDVLDAAVKYLSVRGFVAVCVGPNVKGLRLD